jgi:hypothetical protein
MIKPISFDDLPQAAKDGISEQQKSYIDEFTFLTSEDGSRIEAWYAQKLLAIWDGQGWMAEYSLQSNPIYGKLKRPIH